MLLENNIPYKMFNEIDISAVEKRLTEIDSKVWYLDQSRQANGFGPHQKTTSIILKHCRGEPEFDYQALENKNEHRRRLFNVNDLTYENFVKDVKNIRKINVDDELCTHTDAIVRQLEDQFDGISANVIFARLPAGTNINKHKDPGYYLSIIHRLHIPITTNERVEFSLGGIILNMKKGVLYEINNLLEHSVHNLGDSDRIHLIVDIIPKNKYPRI